MCRDTRRNLARLADDDDSDPEPQPDEQGDRRRQNARQFLDDEAIEVQDTDEELLDIRLTPPAQLTPTQTQDDPPPAYYRR